MKKVACVAGGIVGARNNVLTADPLKASGEAANNFIPLAYNTASYAGYEKSVIYCRFHRCVRAFFVWTMGKNVSKSMRLVYVFQ